MSANLQTQSRNESSMELTMASKDIQVSRSMKRVLVNAGKIVLYILGILLVAYLAFFCILVVHEWMGHILADEYVFARHGTTFASFEVIMQFFSVSLQDGRWSVGLVPFRIGAIVVSAISRDPITSTDWEIGFENFMGSGITALVSLVALTVLNLRKDLPRFPWFAGFFSLYSVIFDQILYTFGNPAEALDGAILMGADPLLFKIIVIGLVLLQGLLMVRIAIRYRRGRQARMVVSN